MAGSVSNLVPTGAVDSVAHIVQVALTPVFLLSGIGTLLNMFNLRLGRVCDHAEHMTELIEKEADPARAALIRAHQLRLWQRRFVLDTAIAFAAIGGAATCAAAFVLFVGGMRDAEVASWLFALFGLSLACTVLALVSFLADSVLAWHGLRREGPLPRAKPA